MRLIYLSHGLFSMEKFLLEFPSNVFNVHRTNNSIDSKYTRPEWKVYVWHSMRHSIKSNLLVQTLLRDKRYPLST